MLEQSTRLLALQDENINHESALASSSKVSLPPYRFETECDQTLSDNEFLEHIRNAVEQERNRRFLARQQTPSLVPQPYSWLPQEFQTKFSGLKDLVPLKADCFTVIAYETIPQCTTQIAKLLDLIDISFGHKPQPAMKQVVEEASSSLKVLSVVTTKFVLLQNHKSSHSRFSDLDSLYYEFSTALVFGQHQKYEFPAKDLNLLKKVAITSSPTYSE